MVRTQFDTTNRLTTESISPCVKGCELSVTWHLKRNRAQQNDGKEHSPMNGNQRGNPLGGLTNSAIALRPSTSIGKPTTYEVRRWFSSAWQAIPQMGFERKADSARSG